MVNFSRKFISNGNTYAIPVEENIYIYRLESLKKGSIDILKYEKDFLTLKMPFVSLWYIENVPGANVSEHENVIVESGILALIYSLALLKEEKDIDIDIKALGRIILDSNDVYYNLCFAFVKEADVFAHVKVAIERGGKEAFKALVGNVYGNIGDYSSVIQAICSSLYDPETIIDFARDHRRTLTTENINTLGSSILSSKNAEWCMEFAGLFGNVIDIEPYEQIVLDAKNPKYSRYFAEAVKDANIDKHEQIVLDAKNPIECYRFAQNVKDAKIADHQKVVLDSKDAVVCNLFAHYVKGADIEALENVVLESNNPRECLSFVLDVPCRKKQPLIDVVLRYGDVEQIRALRKGLFSKTVDENTVEGEKSILEHDLRLEIEALKEKHTKS